MDASTDPGKLNLHWQERNRNVRLGAGNIFFFFNVIYEQLIQKQRKGKVRSKYAGGNLNYWIGS